MRLEKLAKRRRFAAGFTVAWLAVMACGSTAMAQNDPHMFAAYFDCDAEAALRQDEIMRTRSRPIFDAAVDSGEIFAWGWMVHEAGGDWRRVQFVIGNGLPEVLAAQQRLDRETRERQGARGPACEPSDAYLWKPVTGNTGSKRRGTQGFSTYYACELTRHEHVDELARRMLAPVLGQLVEDGVLVSWGWQARVVGGDYSRMLTMTSVDDAALAVATRKLSGLGRADPLFNLINEFCPRQVSYIWDLTIDKR